MSSNGVKAQQQAICVLQQNGFSVGWLLTKQLVHIMSVAWQYCELCPADNKLAICNDCNEPVKQGGTKTSSFSTSNSISHLKKNHKEIHTAYKKKQEEKKTKQPSATHPQLSFKDSAEKKQKYHKDHLRAKALTQKIM